MQRELVIVADTAVLVREAALRVRAAIRDAVQARGRCAFALAGGRTPRGVYELLTHPVPPVPLNRHGGVGELEPAPSVDWSAVEFWFGDERHVPPDHPDSNYRMAHEALLSHLPITPAQVHRMHTEAPDAADVAAQYEDELKRAFAIERRAWPVFDLVLLGMGSDGHTASLFPGTPVLEEREHLAAAVWVTTLQTSRVTLTMPVFNHARHVIVLVSGVEKAEALHAVLEGPLDRDRLPIQGIQPLAGALTFLVDEPAASRLTARPRSAIAGG